MVEQRGRDTETNLFGNAGGYKTTLCKNRIDKPHPTCGTIIKKEAYPGAASTTARNAGYYKRQGILFCLCCPSSG
jgi:hypothetical protein